METNDLRNSFLAGVAAELEEEDEAEAIRLILEEAALFDSSTNLRSSSDLTPASRLSSAGDAASDCRSAPHDFSPMCMNCVNLSRILALVEYACIPSNTVSVTAAASLNTSLLVDRSLARLSSTFSVASSNSLCGADRFNERVTDSRAGTAFCPMASRQHDGSNAVIRSSV